MSKLAVVVLVAAASSPARADDADALVAQGEELGRQGEWTKAIVTFKHADAVAKRTKHACMIGLAYSRREMWAQAELYFARCRERAKTGEPAPEWIGDAERQLATKIASLAIPAIAISVDAPQAAIAVSGFEPDDTLVPGTIHLPPGHYTLRATAPDRVPASRELEVAEGAPQAVAFTLVPARRPNPARDTRLPLYLIGGGAALLGAGALVDAVKLQPLRDQLAKSQFENMRDGEFSSWRTTTVALWGAGAIALGVGVWLEVRRREAPLTIAASVDRGGAFVAIGWSQ